MKKISFFILTLVFNLFLNAQTVDFGKFPSEKNGQKPIATSDLLKSLDWENLKRFSYYNEGHYVHERKDSLLVEYEYVQQGRVADFEITSYNGNVLEYSSQISNTSKQTNTNYFDKNVWLEYAHSYLPNLPDSLKLNAEESKTELKAYYRLIGVGTSDEYGWICEYSTVGRATERRYAIIKLLQYGRRDLIKRLISYPNIEVQLYVIDALIYDDFKTRKHITENLNPEVEELLKERDSLKKIDSTNWQVKSNNNRITDIKEYIEGLNSELLNKKDWDKIYSLKNSNQKVKTCRSGTGSYKTYENNTLELLSDQAISEIPKRYSELENLGYFR